MTIREELEWTEHLCLSERAQFSDATRGRPRPEEAQENDVRTCYQRDSDRILHSKSFRRLMHKTQVFLQPEGDHYRTRMTHTLEVARIARTITRALRLNEDLSEAIAFGHDLGHTPFGHAGEVALTEVMGEPFRHNEQSLRVVDVLEKDGQGLNLTYEELDKLVTEGEELGIHWYMCTGGEPMCRKNDLLKLAAKHQSSVFHLFTNGTLIDDAFCEEVKKVGNMAFFLSVEGLDDATDSRRGEGVFQRVMNAMDIMKKHGLLFGTSICYTSANYKAVTSDEFMDMLISHGVRFNWYFHYMPIGDGANVDLMLNPEQREYMIQRVREIRGFTGGKQIFCGVAYSVEFLKPEFCVFLFVFGGFQKQSGNLLVALFFCNRSKVRVLVASLRFSRKRSHEIFLGSGSSILVVLFHNITSLFLLNRNSPCL